MKHSARTRIYSGYNHSVPIAGRLHDVQTEFVHGDPPKIVSHAFVSGRVVASHASTVGTAELEDDLKVRALIKQQQKEIIRQLVVAERERNQRTLTARPVAGRAAESTAEERPAQRAEGVAAPPSRVSVIGPAPQPGESAASPAAPIAVDVERRRELVRFSRSAGRLGVAEPLAQLSKLANLSARIMGRGFDGGRSEEAAELLLLRYDSLECVRSGDRASAPGLVEQFMRLAEDFAGINDRAALQEHDHQEWTRAIGALASRPEHDRASDDELLRLRSTWGRDLRVDELLDDPGVVRSGPLRDALVAALDQLKAEMRGG